MVKRTLCAALFVALGATSLVNCADEPSNDVPPLAPQGLAARDLLIRASLDIRGTRPTGDELARIAADPAEVDEMVAAMVDDPRFGERVSSIFAAAYRTRRDEYTFGATDYGRDEADDAAFQRAVAEEVPHIIGHIAVTDAPFTDILTVDYTVVDPILLEVWPLEAVEPQPDDLPPGTVMAHYIDGRPDAGVMSTNSLYWRHTSTVENANRGRTNALSRALLCEDYLERPIDFPKDVDLTDTESIHQAIRQNEACQACHGTMDPVASHLWGFMQTSEDAITWSYYHPENERMWQSTTETVPGYFGGPSDGTLDGLAVAIGSDERFVTCAVRRVYEGLLGRRAALADEGQLAAHRDAFLASGLSLKALARSILSDPAYRGRRTTSDYGGTPEPVEEKLLAPEIVESSLADLSGYRLVVEGRNAIEVDFGLRALAGGGERGATPDPSPGHVLVHRRLAEAAASAVVSGDDRKSRVSVVLAGVDMSAAPSAASIVALVREIRSRDLPEDSDEVAQLGELWQAVREQANAREAWTAVLTALFADPELAVY